MKLDDFEICVKRTAEKGGMVGSFAREIYQKWKCDSGLLFGIMYERAKNWNKLVSVCLFLYCK